MVNDGIVLFATKIVGIEVFKFLLVHKYNICGVVSDDVNIYNLALDNDIPTVKFSEFNLGFLDSIDDYIWLVNAWSPHYLNNQVLEKFKFRLNIHPSYAPYSLGNDNASWSIMDNVDGEIIAGASLLEMTDKIDEGGIWARSRVKVSFPIKGKELQDILIDECVRLFCSSWNDIYSGVVKPQQIPLISKHTRKQTNDKKILKSSDVLSVYEIVNNILANDFSPNYTSILDNNGEKYKITINLEKINEVCNG